MGLPSEKGITLLKGVVNKYQAKYSIYIIYLVWVRNHPNTLGYIIYKEQEQRYNYKVKLPIDIDFKDPILLKILGVLKALKLIIIIRIKVLNNDL